VTFRKYPMVAGLLFVVLKAFRRNAQLSTGGAVLRGLGIFPNEQTASRGDFVAQSHCSQILCRIRYKICYTENEVIPNSSQRAEKHKTSEK